MLSVGLKNAAAISFVASLQGMLRPARSTNANNVVHA
jgi:hypothetical protein